MPQTEFHPESGKTDRVHCAVTCGTHTRTVTLNCSVSNFVRCRLYHFGCAHGAMEGLCTLNSIGGMSPSQGNLDFTGSL